MATTLTPEQRARGGHNRAANLTPEQRQEIGRKGYLAAAVKAVVDRAPELTPDQVNRLRTLFAPDREAVSR